MNHPSHHATLTPQKIAYQMAHSGQGLTYRQLDEQSNQAAHAFRSLNINAGDHIALMLENRLEMMVLIWAAQRSGIIFTPISRYLQQDEVSFILQDCGARLLITSGRYEELAAKLTAVQPFNIPIYSLDGASQTMLDWPELAKAQTTSPVSDQQAGAGMLYSSGTTGRPKGILRKPTSTSIGTLSPVLMKVAHELGGMRDTSTYLSPAPLYHSAPMAAAMIAGGLGATTIIMERFDETEMLRLIEQHNVTHTQVVPTMFVRLAKLPDTTKQNYDISSLEAAIHVAAPCPVDIKKHMIDWWGPILVEYYAGTEGNGVAACKSDEWLNNIGTVGRSLYGTIHILDDEGCELPAGKIGNVYFNSGLHFSYHNDAEKTANAYSRQGWSTLGDIGWLNDDGFLFLTDRKNYTIISGGVNIYPQETEDVLVSHPAVFDVAVFGVPNEELGEEVKAVVQPMDFDAAGSDLEQELIEFCKYRVSSIKTPKSIDFRKELPRTPTGKLVKRYLKDGYWNKN